MSSNAAPAPETRLDAQGAPVACRWTADEDEGGLRSRFGYATVWVLHVGPVSEPTPLDRAYVDTLDTFAAFMEQEEARYKTRSGEAVSVARGAGVAARWLARAQRRATSAEERCRSAWYDLDCLRVFGRDRDNAPYAAHAIKARPGAPPVAERVARVEALIDAAAAARRAAFSSQRAHDLAPVFKATSAPPVERPRFIWRRSRRPAAPAQAAKKRARKGGD